MAPTTGTAGPTWALPPWPPETWAGSGLAVVAVGAVVAAALLPVLLVEGAGLGATVLYAVAAAAAAGTSAILLLQAAIAADPRLRWLAAGYAVVLVLVLVAAAGRDAAAPVQERLGTDAALALLGQLVLPLVALTAPLARRSTRLVALPLAGPVVLAVLAVLAPGALPPLVTADGRLLPLLSVLVQLTGVLAAVAAVVWLRHSPRGWQGPWGWVSAGLVLAATAGVVGSLAAERGDPAWWGGLVAGLLTLLVPALGLTLHCSSGYWRQVRRWRQLETSVRALRVSSPLLPGLSVTPEDDEGLPAQREVEVLLRDGRLQTALQPVVVLSGGAVVGYEALARFGGRVPTDRWFRGASRAGLGGALEVLTLRSALARLPELPEEVFLSVNLSPVALTDPAVLALLEAVDLSRIVVEVTEHDAVPDYAQARRRLDRLRRQGARIAVDDTGAGFASLKHVLLLQPDLVKLDISLSRGVEHDGPQRALVRALLRFSDEVGMVVVAEGVETREQLDALRSLGVPLGQGWHLGVPALAR